VGYELLTAITPRVAREAVGVAPPRVGGGLS
jgi:hypothetical protein